MKPIFFKSHAEFRVWLRANYDRSTEVLVGFHKVASGKPSLTWPAAVDQALCFGWIDGVRKGVDNSRYTIRFTPRKPNSIWSAVNIRKVGELTKAGLMWPAGLKRFNDRDEKKSKLYSFEGKNRGLDSASEKRFRIKPKAWAFFKSQAPSYQKGAGWWVVSAKQEKTKAKRLETLIADSQKGQRLEMFRKWKKS
ncbi:MAG TPA: YdeI/OmpD-associated family protein [bacterium]